MNVNDFVRRWPYCYHVTFAVNLDLIQTSRSLYSAEALLLATGEVGRRQRRMTDQLIRIKGQSVVLRNQCALNPQALDLPRDCTLEDYLAFLNERTYFWPGTSIGPVTEGIRLLATHGSSLPAVVIRVQSMALLEANANATMHVATCNTGAAWMDGSGMSRRALDAFCPLPEYANDTRAIVEVSFVNAARLPKCSEYSAKLIGPWDHFFMGETPGRTL